METTTTTKKPTMKEQIAQAVAEAREEERRIASTPVFALCLAGYHTVCVGGSPAAVGLSSDGKTCFECSSKGVVFSPDFSVSKMLKLWGQGGIGTGGQFLPGVSTKLSQHLGCPIDSLFELPIEKVAHAYDELRAILGGPPRGLLPDERSTQEKAAQETLRQQKLNALRSQQKTILTTLADNQKRLATVEDEIKALEGNG